MPGDRPPPTPTGDLSLAFFFPLFLVVLASAPLNPSGALIPHVPYVTCQQREAQITVRVLDTSVTKETSE